MRKRLLLVVASIAALVASEPLVAAAIARANDALPPSKGGHGTLYVTILVGVLVVIVALVSWYALRKSAASRRGEASEGEATRHGPPLRRG